MTAKKSVLFVCVENSNRSQIAEAFAKMLGGDAVESYSAGSKPSGTVNAKTVEAMRELGYDLSTHRPKGVEEIPAMEYDAVITMGCNESCPYLLGRIREDWGVPDPTLLSPADLRKVRDLIGKKVKDLLGRLASAPLSQQDAQ